MPPLPIAPGVFMRCTAVTTAGFTAVSNRVSVAVGRRQAERPKRRRTNAGARAANTLGLRTLVAFGSTYRFAGSERA